MGAAAALAVAASAQDKDGARDPPYARLLGTQAPEWSVSHWMNSKPLTLEGLRGRPVLVRWWTGPRCSYCAASAPVLERIHRRYKKRGLVVVGFYHHKSSEPLDPSEVRRIAGELGMGFPVAVDEGWATLKRYWLDRVPEGSWTSVTFLIGPDGTVRHVHPGGTITEGDGRRIEAEIERILGEKRRPGPR